MKNINIFRLFKLCIVFILLFDSSVLFSQENQPEPKTQPLELHNFIIEGKEQLNVQVGVKQYPIFNKVMTASEIDSLNPIQKQQAVLLAPKTLPDNIYSLSYNKGFLSAFAGNYISADINAGYEIKDQEYSFFGDGYFNYSDGFVKNSGYTKGGLGLQIDYIAPSKFWIFGGSKTRGNIDFGTHSYKLYGSDSAFKRSKNEFTASINSEGDFQGFNFLAGLGIDVFSLSHDGAGTFDNGLDAFIKINKATGDFDIKLLSDLTIHNTSDGGLNLFDICGGIKFNLKEITLDVEAGFQSTGSTDEIQRANIKMDGKFEYRLSQDISLKARLDAGFDKYSFSSLFKENIYIENKPIIDFSYHRIFSASINYHPLEDISAEGGVKIGAIDRQRFYIYNDLGGFNLAYSDAQLFELFVNSYWYLSSDDRVSGSLNLKNLTFSDSLSNKIPFVPSLILNVNYQRFWTEKFGTQIGLDYQSKRYSDYLNKEEIDAFLNLNLELNYILNNYLNIYGKIDNLINSEIYFWKNYKEREIFLTCGIVWQF